MSVDFFKDLIRNFWPLYMLSLLVIKPKKFRSEYYYAYLDYRRFFSNLSQLNQKLCSEMSEFNSDGAHIIVFGKAMNLLFLHLWVVLGLLHLASGRRVYALSSKNNPLQNLYLRRAGFHILHIEDLDGDVRQIAPSVVKAIRELKDFPQVKDFELSGIPYGKMALSTYSRQRATGITDIDDPKARRQVLDILVFLIATKTSADHLYSRYGITTAYFAEVFMEEYGALYYSALKREINIIRFNGTVRDNAVVVQHMTELSDRTHFSALGESSWNRLMEQGFTSAMEAELMQNFEDRYSNKWDLSSRNQPNTAITPPEILRQEMNLKDQDTVGIIYSHILYDTLFFNGEYLFENYAVWLIESVKAACENPNICWYIKVHPSNLWRGELEFYHKGKYEEVRLIEEYIGPLPSHVNFIFPDTPHSPYSWLQVADIGVTVTGTSGIELGALGKTVITAGTGRYENIGFTKNSNSPEEYLQTIKEAHLLPRQSEEQVELGKRFAHATFCMKPFTLDFVEPRPRKGKSRIFGADDLAFDISFSRDTDALPSSLRQFFRWSAQKDDIDFLTQEVG